MTYFVPKDILFVVDKDDNVGDDGMLMMVMLTYVVSLDVVVDYDHGSDGDGEYYCWS